MIRFALLALVAGCFTRPELKPNDAPLGDDDGAMGDRPACTPSKPSAGGVTLDLASGEWTAHMEGNVSITFANDGSYYPMPNDLRIGGEELIANPTTGCGVEDQVGIAVYPMYAISENQSPTGGPHVFDRNVVGPAYTEVRANWSYERPTTCGATAPRGDGHSTFGFFPDGHVVRNDYLHPSNNGAYTPAGCSCVGPAPGGFLITSYMAFDLGLVAALTRDSDDLENESGVPIGGAQHDDWAGACFNTDAGAAVAVRFESPSPGNPTTRIRNAGSLIFVQDIRRGEIEIDSSESYGSVTHYYLKPSGTCVPLNAAIDALARLPSIRLAGMQMGMSSYGFYDDPEITTRAHAGPIVLEAAFGSLAPGFALRVQFPGFSAIATDREADRVVWQRGPDDFFYIWFRDPLVSNESITITPECGP